MRKASEVWKEITPKISEMLVAVNDIETQAEKAQEAAYAHGYSNAEIKYRAEVKEAYQKGLEDAWECARKIINLPNMEDRENIFGRAFSNDVIKDYPVGECIEKIKAYEEEQKKQEEIKVGDEVRNINGGWTAVVSKIDGECMTLMDTNGALGDGYDVNRFTKTGRHFPEIATVLEKMKEMKEVQGE